MDDTVSITNHSLLEYYIYNNGNITETNLIKNNILKDYNMSNVFLDIKNFKILQSNRYLYYTQKKHDIKYLLSMHPKMLPILINDNTIIK